MTDLTAVLSATVDPPAADWWRAFDGFAAAAGLDRGDRGILEAALTGRRLGLSPGAVVAALRAGGRP